MAEPEAEADPALLYGGYYGYPYHYGYPLVKANTGELPYSFGWTDGPNNGLGVAGRKRREADEDVMSGPAPIAKANTGELPYTFGWTDGPNNGLGVAGRKR